MQNEFYKGYTQFLEVINLIFFNFKGEIIHPRMNLSGSWHDRNIASISGLMYPKLFEDMNPPGMAIMGQRAFVVNGSVIGENILTDRKRNETSRLP